MVVAPVEDAAVRRAVADQAGDSAVAPVAMEGWVAMVEEVAETGLLGAREHSSAAYTGQRYELEETAAMVVALLDTDLEAAVEERVGQEVESVELEAEWARASTQTWDRSSSRVGPRARGRRRPTDQSLGTQTWIAGDNASHSLRRHAQDYGL